VASTHTLAIKVLEYQEDKTAEAGTDTTNITIEGHGMVDGDFIINTTRRATTQNSAERGCRKVTYVDDDNVSIDTAITGQTTGDTIKIFKWIDRVGYLEQKTFSLTKKVQGESNCRFRFSVNYVE
jgi:hypothetical protein